MGPTSSSLRTRPTCRRPIRRSTSTSRSGMTSSQAMQPPRQKWTARSLRNARPAPHPTLTRLLPTRSDGRPSRPSSSRRPSSQPSGSAMVTPGRCRRWSRRPTAGDASGKTCSRQEPAVPTVCRPTRRGAAAAAEATALLSDRRRACRPGRATQPTGPSRRCRNVRQTSLQALSRSSVRCRHRRQTRHRHRRPRARRTNAPCHRRLAIIHRHHGRMLDLSGKERRRTAGSTTVRRRPAPLRQARSTLGRLAGRGRTIAGSGLGAGRTTGSSIGGQTRTPGGRRARSGPRPLPHRATVAGATTGSALRLATVRTLSRALRR